MKQPARRALRAAEIPQSVIDKYQAQKHTWINISQMFEVSQQTIVKNWRSYPGFPSSKDPQETVDFMIKYQSRDSTPISDDMAEVRDQRERKELEKVSRQVDKATLEVAELKKTLCRTDSAGKAINSMSDVLSNTLVRHDGICVEQCIKYWQRKFKDKPPRKVTDMLKAISKPVVDRIKEDLATEGEDMFKMLTKRDS